MTYLPNVPQATDIPSQSQAQFLTNFQQLDSVFAANHVTFDDATVANRGKHKFTTLIEQSGTPATAADEIALYSLDVSGVTQLAFRRESNGTAIQLTGPGDTQKNFSGFSFLPGGIKIIWGIFSIFGGNNSAVVPYATTFTANTFSLVITGASNASADLPSFTNLTNTGFTGFRIGSPVNAVQYRYIAIGD